MNTFDPASRITMKVDDDFVDFLSLFFCSVEAALDFQISWVFDFEILPGDGFVLNFEGLVSKISDFISVARWPYDNIGNFL